MKIPTIMKPLVQRLPLNPDNSFVAKTFRTPHFEVGWHQHIEIELILFTEGAGLSFVGNYVGKFEAGDIYLLGSHLPHTFQKHTDDLITSAVVVQFRDDFWGDDFIDIPEARSIKQLLQASRYGLKILKPLQQQLAPLIQALEHAGGFKRILLLGECLHLIAGHQAFISVSTHEINAHSTRNSACIDQVFKFTIDSFKDNITLSRVAAIACMSVPAFCNYFKKSTKKTYIDFLNEVRIGYACTQLIETQKSVLDICYESGYNTIANFHKQFFKLKQITPLQYRKQFSGKSLNKIGASILSDY